MSTSFFSNFPTTTYSNNRIVDITERVVVKNETLKNPYIYYPLTLLPGVRPDNVAYEAYGDPYLSWVLYMTNGITDPYYDWYMNDVEFDQFITLKYGSIANAMTTIAYYQNNWVDQPQISPAAFSDLPAEQQSFWEPNYGYYGTPISYSRRQVDWCASTNYVLGLGLSNAASFQYNEPVTISYEPNVFGSAQVKQSNSTVLIVQHVSGFAFPTGNVAITSNSYVYGTKSGANVGVTNCVFLANNISSDLQDYYAPVYFYDIENERNVGNRYINVLQPKYAPGFVNTVSSLLAANVVVI